LCSIKLYGAGDGSFSSLAAKSSYRQIVDKNMLISLNVFFQQITPGHFRARGMFLSELYSVTILVVRLSEFTNILFNQVSISPTFYEKLFLQYNPIPNEASLTLDHDGGGERVRGFIGNGIYLGNDETKQGNKLNKRD